MAGATIPPGIYGGVFWDGVDNTSFGAEQFAFDFPVTLIYDSEVQKNLLLLINGAVLPHIPFGSAGPLSIGSKIVVVNSHGVPVQGEVEFFDTVTGGDLPVTIDGTTAAEHEFVVPARSTLTLDVSSSDPLRIAWGLGYGTRSLDFSAIFSTVSRSSGVTQSAEQAQLEGSFVGEAGISASEISTAHVLSVERTDGGVDTAFAVVNPTSATANITVALADDNDVIVAQMPLVLEPHTQTAQFFLPFFSLANDTFSGTVTFDSDTDIAVMSLRTLDGVQTSSLVSGSFGN